MTWFKMPWNLTDAKLLQEYRSKVGKNVRFIDETILDDNDLLAAEDGLPLMIPMVLGESNDNIIDVIDTLKKEKTKGNGKKKRLPFTKEQRASIVILKGKTCSSCNETDSNLLQVHHSDGNPSNNNLDNLILLCYKCHKVTHKRKIQQNL